MRRPYSVTAIVAMALALAGGGAFALPASATPTRGAASAKGADLTPAQECGISATGSSALRKPVSATVGGWAFVGNLLALEGASVRLRTATGRTIPLLDRRSAKTGESGAFLVSVRSLPQRFSIEISGGRIGSELFRGTLRTVVHHSRSGRSPIVYVTPASTLAAAYLASHPARSVGTAASAVKQFLGIPHALTLGFDFQNSSALFDGSRFLSEARGHVNRFLRRLAIELNHGGRHAFPGSEAPRDAPGLADAAAFKLVGTELAKGAISYLGGLGAGWILSQFGIQDGVSAQIDKLSGQLTQISQQIADIDVKLSKLQLDVTQIKFQQTLAPAIPVAQEVKKRMADLRFVANLAHQVPVQSREEIKKAACDALKDLATLGRGGGESDITDIFFPTRNVLSITQAGADLLHERYRWWTNATRDELGALVSYWIGVQASWLTLKLEWEHAVRPCPPTGTAGTCQALRWASKFLSDAEAELETLPPPVPEGTWIQKGSPDDSKSLMWGPTKVPPQTYAHRAPARFFQIFWRESILGAAPVSRCTDFEVTICAIEGAGRDGAGFGGLTDWRLPTLDEVRKLIDGWTSDTGVSPDKRSPLAYLTGDPPVHPGVATGWFGWGGSRIFTGPCRLFGPVQGDAYYVECGMVDLDTGQSAGLPDHVPVEIHPAGADRFFPGGPDVIPHANFILVRDIPDAARYWTAQLSSTGSRYVSETDPAGADTINGKSNDCRTYPTPCKTIEHAVNEAVPGDVVRVAGGTYPGGFRIDKNVTLLGNGPNMTVITGGNPVVKVAAGSPRIGGVTITSGATGIAVDGGATLADSVIVGNKNANGSALLNTSGTSTLLRTAVTGNTVTAAGNDSQPVSVAGGTLELVNSTVAGNSGGVGIRGTAQLVAINSTIARNDVAPQKVPLVATGAVQMANTLLAGNVPGVTDCYGRIESLPAGHNFIENAGPQCNFRELASSGNLIGRAGEYPGDPKLGTLGLNGGPMPIVPLLEGSVAIGAADAATCADAKTVARFDERGFVRPSGSCDIGAYDSNAVPQAQATG